MQKVGQGDWLQISFCFLRGFIWGGGRWSASWFQYVPVVPGLAAIGGDLLKFDFLEMGL